MGFYLRKSVSFGGVRFNFSKSGTGVSVGVKGFRIGTGAKGYYVHIGKNGVNYQAALGTKKTKVMPKQPVINPSINPETRAQNELLFQEIESDDIAQIIDSSSQDLINEINCKKKIIPFWPFMFLLALIPVVGPYFALFAVIGTYLLIDRKRKTTIIFYNIEQEIENKTQIFYNAFQELFSSQKKWHVSAQARVHNQKYHAGADTVVKRTPINVVYKAPPGVKTNVLVPSVPVGKQTIYFLPERILIYQGRQVVGIGYENLTVAQQNQQFVESGIVPRDATVIYHTWQYVNKSGEPDKRFKYNRQIPVVLYSDIEFKSSTGLNELIELSKCGAGKHLNKHLLEYSQNHFLLESNQNSLSLKEYSQVQS